MFSIHLIQDTVFMHSRLSQCNCFSEGTKIHSTAMHCITLRGVSVCESMPLALASTKIAWHFVCQGAKWVRSVKTLNLKGTEAILAFSQEAAGIKERRRNGSRVNIWPRKWSHLADINDFFHFTFFQVLFHTSNRFFSLYFNCNFSICHPG